MFSRQVLSINISFLVFLQYSQLIYCTAIVEPELLLSEVHQNASFSCLMDAQIIDANWTLPSGELLLPNKTSVDKRFINSNGTLSILNVLIEDSGEYICSLGENLTATGVLKSFVMPTYTLDFSLICGLNIILLISFIVANVINHLRYNTSGSVADFKSGSLDL